MRNDINDEYIKNRLSAESVNKFYFFNTTECRKLKTEELLDSYRCDVMRAIIINNYEDIFQEAKADGSNKLVVHFIKPHVGIEKLRLDSFAKLVDRCGWEVSTFDDDTVVIISKNIHKNGWYTQKQARELSI